MATLEDFQDASVEIWSLQVQVFELFTHGYGSAVQMVWIALIVGIPYQFLRWRVRDRLTIVLVFMLNVLVLLSVLTYKLVISGWVTASDAADAAQSATSSTAPPPSAGPPGIAWVVFAAFGLILLVLTAPLLWRRWSDKWTYIIQSAVVGGSLLYDITLGGWQLSWDFAATGWHWFLVVPYTLAAAMWFAFSLKADAAPSWQMVRK